MGRRGRIWSINWTPSSEPECPPPLPSTFGVSSQQTTHMAAPVYPFPPLHPSSPASPEFSSEPPSISQRKRYIELDDDSPECAVSSTHTDISAHGIRKRRLSRCVSPVPSKRQRHLPAPFKRHSGTNLTPPSDEYRERPPDPDEFLQPMLQVPVNSNFPVNLAVFDWNSIPDPLVGTTSSICM